MHGNGIQHKRDGYDCGSGVGNGGRACGKRRGGISGCGRTERRVGFDLSAQRKLTGGSCIDAHVHFFNWRAKWIALAVDTIHTNRERSTVLGYIRNREQHDRDRHNHEWRMGCGDEARGGW